MITQYREKMSLNIEYTNHDFHSLFKINPFKNEQDLLEKVQIDLFNKIHEQKVLFRVNCYDSIDRTNNILAYLSFHIILQSLLQQNIPDQKINSVLLKKKIYDMFVLSGDLLAF